mgnify:CR=1 FL=1
MPLKTSSTFIDFLRSRRSIRKFNGQKIPDEILREMLETATFAPSAHGLQPWRFAIIDAPAARSTLGTALTTQMRQDMQVENASEVEINKRVERSLKRIAEAPHIILLCRDTEAVRVKTEAEDLMGIQSVAMAGLQLLLAAHAHGLAANWICWPLYAQAATIQALNLPNNWQPQGMVFLGYPAEEPKPKDVKALDKIVLRFDR